MAALTPFFANVASGVTGQTVLVTATTSPGTVVVFPASTNNITSMMVQVQAPAGQAAYIRISNESSTAIAGSSADVPVFGQGTGAATTVRLFAANGFGQQVTVAVVGTVTASPVKVWLTPGQGGVGT